MSQNDTLPQLGPLRTPRDEAASPYLPTWRAEQLARAKTKAVRMALANNPRCAPEALRIMQADRCPDVRILLARHIYCPPDVLAVLAQDPHEKVRLSVAENRGTPAEAVAALAHDPYVQAIERAALENKNCPRATLVEIMERARVRLATHDPRATDLGAFYRVPIAAHPNYPPGDLQILTDPNFGVRAAAARNPASGPVLLCALARDEHNLVRDSVAENSACPPDALRELARSRQLLVLRRVLVHPNTSPELLEELLPDLGPDLCRILANGPHASLDLLTRLSQDRRPVVREAVAANERCPQDVLWELRHDNAVVLACAVTNPACPAALVDFVTTRLRQQAGTDDGMALVRALAERNLPDQLWEVVLEVGAQTAAMRLVENENCPSRVLERLAGDANTEIRWRAKYALSAREEQQTRPVRPVARWSDVVVPLGLAVEQVAWGLLCGGFEGSLQTLAEVAAGAVAEHASLL